MPNDKISNMAVEVESARLGFAASIAICDAVKKSGLTTGDLAQRVGSSVEEVEDVLAGDTPVTMDVLAAYGLACGVHWKFSPL